MFCPDVSFSLRRCLPDCCRRLHLARPSRPKSASTGRPTTRCRCCSRKRACSKRNSPRTASRCCWVKTARLEQRAAIPQRRLDRLRLNRRLGRPGRQDQRQSDQVDLHLFASGMDRAGHRQGQQDHEGRRPEGQEGCDGARHRSAHLHGPCAAGRRAVRQGHHARAGAAARRRRAPLSSAATSTPGPVSIR